MKLSELQAYSALYGAVVKGEKCGWLNDRGDTVVGLARRFVGNPEFVELMNMELTTVNGFEVSKPLSQLVDDYQDGTFVVGYAT